MELLQKTRRASLVAADAAKRKAQKVKYQFIIRETLRKIRDTKRKMGTAWYQAFLEGDQQMIDDLKEMASKKIAPLEAKVIRTNQKIIDHCDPSYAPSFAPSSTPQQLQAAAPQDAKHSPTPKSSRITPLSPSCSPPQSPPRQAPRTPTVWSTSPKKQNSPPTLMVYPPGHSPHPRTPTSTTSNGSTNSSKGRETVQQMLLSWAQQTLQGHTGVNITNFTSSWVDGLAFAALVHYWRPDLVPVPSLFFTPHDHHHSERSKQFAISPTGPNHAFGVEEADHTSSSKINNNNEHQHHLDNLRLAFQAAEEAGVAVLLDAEDVHLADRKSTLTQLQMYHRALSPRPPHPDALQQWNRRLRQTST